MGGVETQVVRGAHPKLTISREKLASKVRKIYQITGLDSGINFGVHNNSINNLRRGLIERVFYVESNGVLQPPLKPKVHQFRKLKYFRRRLVSIVGPYTPIEREEYPLLYQGRRKAIYQRALETLSERPCTKKDARLKTFVKAEKINFTAKGDPAPRVIQPRDPRYNIEVGKYLKKAEHHIYSAIDTIWGGPTVLKGYTVEQLGGHISDIWSQFRKPCAVGFDAKRFDQHVSVDALRFEHSVYNEIFHSPELARLLSYQLVNSGVGVASDGFARYTVDGCRMSGDINTALGNCLLSCAITHYLCRGIRCRLINNGDDCVLFFESSDLTLVNERLTLWSEFGFSVKFEAPVYELEKVEFCQMQPVNADGWVMCRNPYICTSKDTYSITPWHNPKSALKWVASVGECGLSLTGGIPVMQSFYKCMMRMSDLRMNIKNDVWFSDSGFARLALGGRRSEKRIVSDTRVSFWKAFGILPETQVALEGVFDSYENCGAFGAGGINCEPWTELLKPHTI